MLHIQQHAGLFPQYQAYIRFPVVTSSTDSLFTTVFYLQYRHLQAGTYRQVLYKFRSMCLDAEISDPQLSHSNSNNDSRLTKVGHFIRAYHLVKLPQLYNALRGYMALIEPHPERKFYIDQIMEHDYSILISIRSARA